MYLLQSEASFDSAHFLKNYNGKCKNIHGHRWRIVVKLSGDHLIPTGPKAGMLLDFGDLKSALNSLADEFDHALLIEEGTLKDSTVKALQDEDFRLIFLPFRTTAENFSRYFYDRLVKMGFTPAEVAVYETPINCAIYTGEGGAKIAYL
jgi:6-pyruvoyltetrahydropterin/6-carboxytetrahydropterin synthase